jgi:hypothetical protein
LLRLLGEPRTSRRFAINKNRRSHGQSNKACATAKQMISASFVTGGLPAPHRRGRQSSTYT